MRTFRSALVYLVPYVEKVGESLNHHKIKKLTHFT